MSKVTYTLNGQQVTREEFLAGARKEFVTGPPLTANTYRAHDPLLSDGMGCLKAQVPEMRRMIQHHNIKGVQVKDNGQLEITSRRGRKELLAVRGLVDNDGSYGD